MKKKDVKIWQKNPSNLKTLFVTVIGQYDTPAKNILGEAQNKVLSGNYYIINDHIIEKFEDLYEQNI
jgi:hypothetical protein